MEKQPDAILQEYQELFKEELGTYPGPAVIVETDTTGVTKFLKCRPVPFALREKVNAALDDLIRQGAVGKLPKKRKRETERKENAPVNTGPSPNSDGRANNLVEESDEPARGSGPLQMTQIKITTQLDNMDI
ncbi:Uncharacterized protein TSPI_01105 [Trichinella spiralis]|uniref:Uncharacterized protein n=1 Tax=Trichinella spiralis TaxID=6334 RepID=A0ABR3K8F2_TRISP